ncbi:MAG: hypothetical protein WBC33_01875, partial [Conexibacter sp.]
PRAARIALAVLAASAALVGVVATFAPRTFYDDFPFTAHWVDRLPPYNAHLVTDVGGLYLGFAVLLAWAARSLQRELVRAACVAWSVFSVVHFVFHATHLERFGAADAVAELTSLAAVLALPAIAVWAVGVRDATRATFAKPS